MVAKYEAEVEKAKQMGNPQQMIMELQTTHDQEKIASQREFEEYKRQV